MLINCITSDGFPVTFPSFNIAFGAFHGKKASLSNYIRIGNQLVNAEKAFALNEEWLSSVSVSELTAVISCVIIAFTSKQLMCSMTLEKNVAMDLKNPFILLFSWSVRIAVYDFNIHGLSTRIYKCLKCHVHSAQKKTLICSLTVLEQGYFQTWNPFLGVYRWNPLAIFYSRTIGLTP